MATVVRLAGVSKLFVIQHQKARSFQDLLVNFVHQRSGGSEEFWVLRDVSLEVEQGETLGIIGENGSGKSTILKLITRILEPNAGRVTVTGRVSALIELGAGFHADLTGRENVYLNGSILGLSRRQMAERFDEIVAFSELERFIDTPVKHYSSGMYARLGFSVAISVDPDILIIDEVLAVGDEGFQRKCLDRIDEFRRRGRTVIIVSHALAMVEQLCDRVIWLHQGRIAAQGPALGTIRTYLAEMQRRDERERLAQRRAAEQRERQTVGRLPAPADEPTVLDTRLAAATGEERYAFRTGEAVVVLLAYRVPDPAGAYVLELEVRRSDGLLVHAAGCEVRGAPPPSDGRPGPSAPGEWLTVGPAGQGWAAVEYPALPLLAGTYDVTPSIRRAGRPQSVVTSRGQPCRFSVWSEDAQGGIVAIPHRWASRSPGATPALREPTGWAGHPVRRQETSP